MAKEVVPPFVLTTHSRIPIAVSKEPANVFSNQLLHVVSDGDVEDFLEVLCDDQPEDAHLSDAFSDEGSEDLSECKIL